MAFVIPAYNEARFVSETLDRIHAAMDGGHAYEIVVVDHGSSDGTARLARRHGATVVVHESGTVAALRNVGVRHTSGEIIVFLDADVFVTPAWAQRFTATLAALEDRPRMLTGSWCGIPARPGWIERFWFAPLLHGHNTHINSGHLITTRAFFEELGGFAESLETGEDYDLSMRAIERGGEVVEDPRLAVEHMGYPRTVPEFVRREAWHGRGDFVSITMALRSKIAVATIAFVTLHIVLAGALAAGSAAAAAAAATAILALCLCASWLKYRGHGVRNIPINTVLYYLYFVGRSAALFGALLPGRGRKRQRSPLPQPAGAEAAPPDGHAP
ncbi:MAG TPA: glycosyltransferase [Longimicrobiales bacterium]